MAGPRQLSQIARGARPAAQRKTLHRAARVVPAPARALRVAVVFDTPYPDAWGHAEHLAQLEAELAGGHAGEEPEMEYQVAAALRAAGHDVLLVGIHRDLPRFLQRLDAARPDLVFNCAESFEGDDRLEYVIPSMIEALRLPYVGSAPLGLATSRDKELSKRILAHHGVRVPGFFTVAPGEAPALPEGLRYPLIVKPLATDASLGIAQASVVHDDAELRARVAFVHEQFRQPAIGEEFVDGRELYVSLVGNGAQLDVLPLTELVFDKEKNAPEERIATRAAKWDEAYRRRRGVRNQFARPIAEETRARIADTCRTAFRALQLRDFARCDVRLAADGTVWLLEANANPYISRGHDFALAAEKAGLDYAVFIDRLARTALARAGH